MSFQVEPFDGPIGAAIAEMDLSQTIDPASQEALVDAWNRYSVLVCRDQNLTPEQFIAFSRYFGGLEVHVLDQYLHPDHPEIFIVSNVLEKGRHIGIPDAGRYWHTDLSYMAEPEVHSLRNRNPGRER